MLQRTLELLPAAAFLAVYLITTDLIAATAAIVATATAALAVHLIVYRHVTRLQAVVYLAILLFGLPTVLLNDPAIIKWKATVVNLLIAAIIAFCQFALRISPFALLSSRDFRLPAPLWLRLSIACIIFFMLSAWLNYFIAFRLSEYFTLSAQSAELIWVNYKSYGNGLLNFIFALLCVLYLYRKCPSAFTAVMNPGERGGGQGGQP